MRPHESLLIDQDDGIITLSLSRPERRNAIDRELAGALCAAVAKHGAARAIVLRSAEAGMFCAGADLGVPDEERAEVSRELYALYAQMINASAPIVAALDGPAVGGGAQLAVACDLRVAGPAASIRFLGPGHGLAVGAWALPSLVGRGRALDLCLTGRTVGGDEALQIGLVDRLADDASAGAAELAAGLATLEPDAVARVKAVAARALAGGAAAALELEAEGNARWRGGTPGLRRPRSGEPGAHDGGSVPGQ
ncbi:MAG TPA: enoyl-CoA hydratase/isomerase family protein [Solirubrobacteraceae bacterium]|nr:enoyl-CoA hydratase/isomerase family protein [Solirubrobacteraceae bacterium]